MYIDKDTSGNFSIMAISETDIKDLAAILFDFEHSLSFLTDSEKARLNMFSAKIRFQIIDLLKEHG